MEQTNSGSNQEHTGGFAFRFDGQPDFSYLTVTIPAERTLKVEASAMAAMDTNLKMKTKFKGGLGRFLTGESLFINEFTAQGAAGEISIAPGAPGNMAHVYLNNETLFLQNSGYVASDPNIQLETKWQGMMKGFFSGESFFLIKCSGTGDLWFNTFGALIEMKDVDGSLIVDTGHIVAFTGGLQYELSRLGGYKSLFLSGEGFVCKFHGKGKVWIQTRKLQPLTQWLYWYRPVKKQG
jgi:uncharacterized protein (TIGR00266 family)